MKRRRGASLIELLVCLGLLTGIMAVAAQNLLRGSTTTRRDAVEALSSEVRGLQQRALQENQLIALTLRGNTQRLGFEVGVSLPKLEKVRDFRSDFPDCWFSAATPSQLTSPDPRLVDAWFDGARAAIIFTPSGRILSNLAPGADGAYHLELKRAGGGSWDVRFDPRGDVRFQSTSGAAQAQPATLDRSLALTVAVNQAPQIRTLEALNSGDEFRDGSGVLHLTPAPGSLLTFRLEAEDADGGDQLFLLGQGTGRFSSQTATPMSYDAATQRWIGFVSWQPPEPLTAGSALDFVVTDRQGQVAASNAQSKVVLDGLAQEVVVYAAKLEPDKNNRIYRCNPDGGNRLPIFPDDADLAGPSLSPTGSMIAYWNCDNWPPDLCVAGLNGGAERILATDWNSGGSMPIAWSADSSRVFVSSDTNKIVSFPAAGGSLTVIVSARPWVAVSSPDHRKLAYLRNDTTPPSIEILDLDSGTPTVVATQAAGTQLMMSSCDSPIAFSADSATLYYCVYNSSTQKAKVFAYTSPGPPVEIVDTGGRVLWLRGGAGKRLAYILWASQRELYTWEDYTDSSTRKLVDSRSSNSLYAGCPDRFEFSPDGNRVYWMQGLDSGSHLIRYNFDGSGAVKLSPVGSYYNCTDSNGLDLFGFGP